MEHQRNENHELMQLTKENEELQATSSRRRGDMVEVLLTINKTIRDMSIGARATCHKQSECGGLVHARNQLNLMIEELKDFHKTYNVTQAMHLD